MSKDARAWREEAAAATAGGKHKRALAAYLELERLEVRDAQWPKRAAEAYRKLARDSDAIAAYARSADRYAQNGFLVQAIAVYKLILQIDPRHPDTLRRLSEMNDQIGAGPTRASTMAEHNVGLHENAAVQAIRRPRTSSIVPTPGASGGFALPSEEMILEEFDTAVRGSSAQPTPAPPRTRTASSLQSAAGRKRPDSSLPPLSVSRTRSRPISLSPGLALDSVKMSEAVPESRVHSQAGIFMIPIDDADLIPEADIEADIDAAVEAEEARGEDRADRDSDVEIEIVPERASEAAIQFDMGGDVIDVHPHTVEEPTELDLEDLEEIPLGEPRKIGEQARRALQATPLFAGLPSDALEALVSRLVIVTLEPGDVLFREGDPGDSLYVVVEGEVAMQTEGPPRVELARFGPGAFIGEVALMTDQPRAATVAALEPAELIQINRATLAAVLAEHGDVLRAVLRFVRDRLVDRWMRTSPLFRPFDDRSRAELAARFKFLEIDAGTVILAANQRPDGLYIVLAGQFAVQRGTTTIASLGPGDLIGETALLSGGTFRSNVVALGKSLALCLPAGDFREIIMTHPHVLEYIGEQAEHSRRLQIL